LKDERISIHPNAGASILPLVLHVINCSTRPGRVGPAVAHWFADYARTHSSFDVRLIDIKDFNLPLYDEPHHPKLRKYEREHTRKWSACIAEADALTFVMPEYNAGPCSAFINALTYLYSEWNYKPCSFVSYGGISGGLRAAQVSKQIVTTLKMTPLIEGVPIPFVAEKLDAGRFVANPLIDASADAMLPELMRWAESLKRMRDGLAKA
jgi:NAD(P)H-dependent FMN reductase